MKLIGSNVVLYIEPESVDCKEPLIDEYTKKMAYALRFPEETRVLVGYGMNADSNDDETKSENPIPVLKARGLALRGFHCCDCGAMSSSSDYGLIRDKLYTNSLATHYLAFHRSSISERELEMIKMLPDPEEDIKLTVKELQPP